MKKNIKVGEDERDQYLFIWESSCDGKQYLIKKKGTGWTKYPDELVSVTSNYEEYG